MHEPSGAAVGSESLKRLLSNVNSVVLGKEDSVLLSVVTLLAGGHLLIEDVPGIGKTLLGLALSRSIGASFRRIQFTNDLLPSDITGLNLFNQKAGAFEFRPGPIFSHVVLADEINRSTPKTQSALLEAMSELQVSIEGKTHVLAEPFFVIATQNPIEYHGTFPLPEAQLDRFLMRVQLGYPSADDEKAILKEGDLMRRIKTLAPALDCSEVVRLQALAEGVLVSEPLFDYAVAAARATRSAPHVKLGLSPRGTLALCRASRAHALLCGRDYCVPDDFKKVAVPVIAHRLLFDTGLYGLARIRESEAAVEAVIRSLPVPA
jgi:MoxR-like ATPase